MLITIYTYAPASSSSAQGNKLLNLQGFPSAFPRTSFLPASNVCKPRTSDRRIDGQAERQEINLATRPARRSPPRRRDHRQSVPRGRIEHEKWRVGPSVRRDPSGGYNFDHLETEAQATRSSEEGFEWSDASNLARYLQVNCCIPFCFE